MSVVRKNKREFYTSMLSAKSALLRITSLSLQSIRFRGKINIQRPQKLHYERARLVAVTTPILENQETIKKCMADEQYIQSEINEYEKIIAKEDEWFKIRVALHKQNVHMKSYGKSIMRQALSSTKYEALLPIFESKTCILFSQENKVLQSLKVLKKYPQIIVLFGILENHILSKNELIEFSSMSNATILQAKLVSILQGGGINLVSSLETHQTQLVNLLITHQDNFSK